MKNFKALRVWSKTHGVMVKKNQINECCPQDKLCRLVYQLRRPA